MTLFVAFGRFGNLPHNLGNWGLTKWEDKIENKNNSKSSSLMIIDFSPGGTDMFTASESNFRLGWITSTLQMCRLLNKVDADGFLLDYLTDFTEVNTVAMQARTIDWLYSKETLLCMLQRVCNATERWIVNTTRNTGYINCDIPSNRTSEGSAEYPLTAFRNVRRPRLRGLGYEKRTALYELLSQYDDWIWEWNEQLRSLFEWFPFPTMFPAPAPAPATASATAPVTEEEAMNTSHTKENRHKDYLHPSMNQGARESADTSSQSKRKHLPNRLCKKKPKY